MRIPKRAIALLIASLILAAPAQAGLNNPTESTPTTLYFHIWDTFGKFVINTQPYNASVFETGGVNFPTTDGTPANDVPEQSPVDVSGWDFNTIYGYSTAGPVEYEFTEAGRPRLHPERGIAAEIDLDTEVQPTTFLYVDARGIGGGDDSPAELPQITFRTIMREGDDPGSDLNDGDMIMSGDVTVHLFDAGMCPTDAMTAVVPLSLTTCPLYWDPAYGGRVTGPGVGTQPLPPGPTSYDDMPSEAPDGYPILYPDENGVIALEMPMEIANDGYIPKDEAYNIRLDWFQKPPAVTDGDDQFSQGNLRLVLADEYLPRMELAIMNPVYVEFLHPQTAAGTLLIHAGVNSPWGTYDIDEESIEITITGPSTPITLDRVVAKNQHVHGLHDKAAEVTYIWKFRDEEAALGEYTIDFSVSNVAGTAVASADTTFQITKTKVIAFDEKGEEVPVDGQESSKGSPSVGLIGALALVGAALLLRRREA